MDFQHRWKIIRELGSGGQGKVSVVLDKGKFTNMNHMPESIRQLSRISDSTRDERFIEKFGDAVIDIVNRNDPSNQGALKVLHQPQDARDYEQAEERIKNEIEAMTNLTHPNLLKILESDNESRWFVSQYHWRGTLERNLSLYKGDIARALNAFRPLVEAVSLIHEKGYIHRDVKPQNIFLDSSFNLILGDFGIVFFTDPEHTRVSDTLGNVGSRDWMPGWAMGIRVEELEPSFDVFSLGKLLWSMISGQPLLQLWYYDRPNYNLEQLFPNNRFMKLINNLLSKCVVENKQQCIPDARALLEEINKIQSVIEKNAYLIDSTVQFCCMVCGIGKYVIKVNEDAIDQRNFGITPVSGHLMKIYSCDHCGNVQIFDFPNSGTPPAWR
ncbi:MAG: protein kinase domain-containing protein [Thermodesulfobacteriota bacterium]